MHTLQLTAADGQLLTGQLPNSWAEVPFGPYIDFQATARPVPRLITHPTGHAFASQAGCQALAHLLGLPTGEPLYSQLRRLAHLHELAPWLFDGPLPPAEALVASFTHQGTRYRYASAAELGPAAADRERMLLWCLRETDGHLLNCATLLLATLYTPDGAAPTVALTQAGAQAFEHLPMSLAWPCLFNFLVPETVAPEAVTRYLALRPMVGQALRALEAVAVAPPTPPPARPHLLRRWLSWAWHRATMRPIVLP